MSALKNPSLVVLDNANYHNVKTEDTVCPNFSQKKAVLQNYLTQHNIPFLLLIPKKHYMKKKKKKKLEAQVSLYRSPDINKSS